jgi:hypothetical protein
MRFLLWRGSNVLLRAVSKKAFGDCEKKKRTGLEGKGLKACIVLGRRAQRDRHGTLSDGLFDRWDYYNPGTYAADGSERRWRS